MVSIAHQYRTYRDYMMDWWQENDSPLGPSVHGGAIPGNLGGKAAEAIFRAQGLDQALGTYGALYAEQEGLNKIVIFATQVEGFQLAADAAEQAAGILGLEVLARHRRPGVAAVLPGGGPEDRRPEPGRRHRPGGLARVRGADQGGGRSRPVADVGRRDRMVRGGVHRDAGHRADRLAEVDRLPRRSRPNKSTPAWDFFQPLWDGQTNCTEGVATCPPYDATNQYAFSTYDLFVQTALAVEAAGSYKASAWAPAMFEVGDGGEICYTYADCLKLIREGKDVDYEGVTGPGLYTDGGVNAVTPAYLPFKADGTTGEPVLLDAEKGLEILDQIKTEAKCDPENPPNKCEW